VGAPSSFEETSRPVRPVWGETTAGGPLLELPGPRAGCQRQSAHLRWPGGGDCCAWAAVSSSSSRAVEEGEGETGGELDLRGGEMGRLPGVCG
jgi:hypothetical protein